MKTLDLSAKLFEKYESVHRVFHYYGLLALYALAQTADEAGDGALMKKCTDMLGLYPDNFDHPKYNFDNYQVGGTGKAWLVFKGMWDSEKENVRKYAEKTLCAPKSKEGILSMPHDTERNMIWIDVVYGVTPFMLYAGLALNEEKYIDFAADQCFKMYDIFTDKTNGLLHQSRGFMPNKKLVSPDHWSRGNGWGYLGLTDLVVNLPKDSKHRAKAEEYFRAHSAALIDYQNERGVWRQEIPCDYAWDESSGTGLILYGLGAGLRLGLLDEETFAEPYKRGVEGMIKRFITPDYSTLMGCQGCLCPGEGAQKGSVKAYLTDRLPLTNEPHSFGAIMLALVEAHKNGITEITINQI